jgi:hypothetical protein
LNAIEHVTCSESNNKTKTLALDDKNIYMLLETSYKQADVEGIIIRMYEEVATYCKF